jgi:hypothetical protein
MELIFGGSTLINMCTFLQEFVTADLLKTHVYGDVSLFYWVWFPNVLKNYGAFIYMSSS